MMEPPMPVPRLSKNPTAFRCSPGKDVWLSGELWKVNGEHLGIIRLVIHHTAITYSTLRATDAALISGNACHTLSAIQCRAA